MDADQSWDVAQCTFKGEGFWGANQKNTFDKGGSIVRFFDHHKYFKIKY